MSRRITVGSTDNLVFLRILDESGDPALTVSGSSVDLSLVTAGGTSYPITTVGSGNWTEYGAGWYIVPVPNSYYTTIQSFIFIGSSGGLTVWGEWHDVVAAIPTATENATAVRTNLTTELGRIDVAISSRLSTLGTNAPTNWINAAAIATDAITDAKIATGALNNKGNWNVGKTGYSVDAITNAVQIDLAQYDEIIKTFRNARETQY